MEQYLVKVTTINPQNNNNNKNKQSNTPPPKKKKTTTKNKKTKTKTKKLGQERIDRWNRNWSYHVWALLTTKIINYLYRKKQTSNEPLQAIDLYNVR